MALHMHSHALVRSKTVACCNSPSELSRLTGDRSARCGVGRQRENHHDSRVSGEEMPKRFGVVFGRGWKGLFSLSFGPGVRGSDPGIPNELLVARCASFGRDVEGVDQGTSSLAPVPCEHSQGRVATPSHSWTAVFSEIRKTFVSLGSDGFSFCGPAGSQERFRRFSAALLCSCAVVTPGLASSPVAAVESLPASDFVAAVITLAGALGVLQFFDELAKRDLLEKVTVTISSRLFPTFKKKNSGPQPLLLTPHYVGNVLIIVLKLDYYNRWGFRLCQQICLRVPVLVFSPRCPEKTECSEWPGFGGLRVFIETKSEVMPYTLRDGVHAVMAFI